MGGSSRGRRACALPATALPLSALVCTLDLSPTRGASASTLKFMKESPGERRWASAPRALCPEMLQQRRETPQAPTPERPHLCARLELPAPASPPLRPPRALRRHRSLLVSASVAHARASRARCWWAALRGATCLRTGKTGGRRDVCSLEAEQDSRTSVTPPLPGCSCRRLTRDKPWCEGQAARL